MFKPAVTLDTFVFPSDFLAALPSCPLSQLLAGLLTRLSSDTLNLIKLLVQMVYPFSVIVNP